MQNSWLIICPIISIEVILIVSVHLLWFGRIRAHFHGVVQILSVPQIESRVVAIHHVFQAIFMLEGSVDWICNGRSVSSSAGNGLHGPQVFYISCVPELLEALLFFIVPGVSKLRASDTWTSSFNSVCSFQKFLVVRDSWDKGVLIIVIVFVSYKVIFVESLLFARHITVHFKLLVLWHLHV